MTKFKKKINKYIGKAVNRFTSATVQKSVQHQDNSDAVSKRMSELCRTAGSESCVLLKNENNMLPIKNDEIISVFGRCQLDWFYVGYGSGGDVNSHYKSELMPALRNSGIKINETLASLYEKLCKEDPADDGYWGHWPMCRDEFTLPSETIKEAASKSDKAVIIIGRSSGEDRECRAEKGSWFLTDEETALINSVTDVFSKVAVIFNCGNIMDMSAINAYGNKISAIMYAWQCGMESGNALADILSGKISPSGKLTDTIAENLEAYPSTENFGGKAFNNYAEDIYVGYRYFETFAKEKVLYPFGFGLSYTDFEIKCIKAEITESVDLHITVKNTGSTSGKQTVQVYFEAPQGRLGKPARVLDSYRKTKLLAPDEEEEISFSFALSEMSSYDESSHAYMLEKGTYNIFVGSDVRSAFKCCCYECTEERTVQQLSQCSAPVKKFKRMGKGGKYEEVPVSSKNLKRHILDNLPGCGEYTGDTGIKLSDVKSGKYDMDDFARQLDDVELEAISRGDYVMNSPLGAPGNAGVLGGVTASLRDKGVPPITTTDGPSGIRLSAKTSLMPIGTALACTWNTDLIYELYSEVGKEMKKTGSDVLLAPGMNIHRSPLCGRNFEYFSEDPVLTGTVASAFVRGVQSQGVSACPKHFACNNQETNRTHNDSRVSERALREIYLLGFEICIKSAKPDCIMTSYNKINGVWGHYNYELVTDILRSEWGFDGLVITDWWMRSSSSPEFPKLHNQAYRVRAGVNVLMPGGDRTGKRKPDGTLLKTLGKPEGITRSELVDNAKHVLNLAMKKITVGEDI